MKTLTPYLMFPGIAREAMTFYRDCLGADLQIMPFMDDKGQPLADPNARVMHAQLTLDGKAILQASDGRPQDKFVNGDTVQIAIDCNSVEEIDRLFAAFSEGGTVRQPLGTMFWGARFGMLVDRFGVMWMFNCFLNQ